MASARLFENMFGFSYHNALLIGSAATITYVLIGGFLAVSWTDTVQASLMVTALILVPLMVIYDGGGISQSLITVSQASPQALDLFGNLSFISLISLLAWGLGYFGQPHILLRFMAIKSIKQIPAARKIGMTWMVFCLMGAVAIGVFGIAYFAQHPDSAVNAHKNSETILIELAKQLFNPWITGIVLAAILGAIMSTLSCQLLVSSSALTADIYKSFLRKTASQTELVWLGRAMVLVVSLIAIVIAFDPNSKILKMVSYAWAGFGSAFGPVILLSLFWSRMNKYGALAGIITGAATVVIWKQFNWFGLYEMLPGFGLGLIAVVLGSLLTKAPNASITDLFKQVDLEIKANK